MKKLLSIIASTLLICFSQTPANAGDESLRTSGTGWDIIEFSNLVSLNYAGSLIEGQPFTVSMSGKTCATGLGNAEISLIDGYNSGAGIGHVFQVSDFSFSTSPLIAGAAGTSKLFVVVFRCDSWPESVGSFRSSFLKLTFEAAIGTPSNFSVLPQTGGTAFTTWGVANRATSYTVTAAPGGASCTTTANFCTIAGLTPDETYTFTLTATNSAASTSVGSGPVLMRQPVNVAVALSGGTWRVGETVSTQVSAQGSTVAPTFTWYRCDRAVPVMPSPPPPGDCAAIAGAIGSTYKLVTGDLGKYITAHVFVTSADPQGQMTASNNAVVISAGAVAPTPTPAPDGKPTIVGIPNRIVPIAGGTEITISGTGLAGVTSVTIGGITAEVVAKTDSSITVKAPTASQTGAVDLVITNSKGSTTEKSAVIYSSTQSPATPSNPTTPTTPTTPGVSKVTKTLSVTSFTATQVKLSTQQKTAVKKLIAANPTLTQLTCVAKTTANSVNAKDLANAKARAVATCNYAASLRSNLFVKTSGTASIGKTTLRNVVLTLKN